MKARLSSCDTPFAGNLLIWQAMAITLHLCEGSDVDAHMTFIFLLTRINLSVLHMSFFIFMLWIYSVIIVHE